MDTNELKNQIQILFSQAEVKLMELETGSEAFDEEVEQLVEALQKLFSVPIVNDSDTPKILAQLFPALDAEVVFPCRPQHSNWDWGLEDPESTLAEIVMHLNDKHEWTREQIADWIDSLDLDTTLKPESSGD